MGITPIYSSQGYSTPLNQTSTTIVSGMVRLKDNVAINDEVKKQPLEQ